MSKLSRKTFLLFGSTPGANQIEQFGSAAGGVPNYTTDPAVIQSLSAWLEGWYGAVVGSNLPIKQDLNAFCYVIAYMMAEIFQDGVAPWDSATTYYQGSIVSNGAGSLFVSLTNNNLNNALTSTANWANYSQATLQTFTLNGTWTAANLATIARITTIRNKKSLLRWQPGVIDSYGNLFSWGVNAYGQLGVGDVTSRSSPVLVLGGLTFEQIESGPEGCIGLTQAGAAYAWGSNENGQLGVGDVVSRSSPVAVLGGLRFWKIAVNEDNFQFGLSTSGKLYAWGANLQGQLGVGDVTPRSSPVAVLGGLTFWKIKTGSNGSNCVFGITPTGAAYAWGASSAPDGALGVGDLLPRSSPVAVLGGLTFQDIVLGAEWGNNNTPVIGLTQSGAAYAWGANAFGELGTGNVTPYSSPVAVLGGLTFTKIFGNNSSFFGLTAAGALYAWGSNQNGQLGVGDVIPRSSPVLVLGGLTWAKIVYTSIVQLAGTPKDTVYGITTAGVLYAWGLNVHGQLGVGDVLPRSSPVAVLGGLTVVDLESPSDFVNGDKQSAYAITQSGAVYAWGGNDDGQLGIGNTADQSSPILVLGGVSANTIVPRQTQTVAVTPAQVYNIVITQFQALFGSMPVDYNVDQMIVEFDE